MDCQRRYQTDHPIPIRSVEIVSETRFSVSVIIPAFSEEKTIASVVKGCIPFADEVLVVNDGSTDDTMINARGAGAHVIELEHNMGVMKAIQRGLKEASGDIIVTLDADGQHDPTEIPRLLHPILEGKADLVMGERPSFPHLSEKILTLLTSLRVPCKDVSTGFRAIKRDIVEQMVLQGSVCAVLLSWRLRDMGLEFLVCQSARVRRIRRSIFASFLSS